MMRGQLTAEDKRLEAQAREDFRWLLGDPRGRRIALTVLRWSGIDEDGPTAGVEAMAFAAGLRCLGVTLRRTIIKHSPESWLHLEADHLQELERERDRLEREAAEKGLDADEQDLSR